MIDAPLTKQQRLQMVLAGETPDRLPVMCWRHFPGDDQRAADLAHAHIGYQAQFDWDVLAVVPSIHFCVTGHGLQDAWQGNVNGTRDVVRYGVQQSIDWTRLRTLDPARGETGRLLECLRVLGNHFNADTPLMQVIYSPLTQAAQLAGTENLVRYLRTTPDRLHHGLNILTETTLNLLEALQRTRIAGVVYVTTLADYTQLSLDEYATFGVPYDRTLLNALAPNWWLNMLQVRGALPMLDALTAYPVQVLSWEDNDGQPSLAEAPAFNGAICGGLSATALHTGTPAILHDAARQARQTMHGKPFMLGCGTVVPVTTPLSNLQAVRDMVQG